MEWRVRRSPGIETSKDDRDLRCHGEIQCRARKFRILPVQSLVWCLANSWSFAAPKRGQMQGGATQAMRGSSSRSARAADGFSPVHQTIKYLCDTTLGGTCDLDYQRRAYVAVGKSPAPHRLDNGDVRHDGGPTVRGGLASGARTLHRPTRSLHVGQYPRAPGCARHGRRNTNRSMSTMVCRNSQRGVFGVTTVGPSTQVPLGWRHRKWP
jgi:hypothetical protein